MIAEQQAGQQRLIELEKHMIPDSSKKDPLYHFRNGKTVSPQDGEDVSRHVVSKRSSKSIAKQLQMKRPRKMQTTGEQS